MGSQSLERPLLQGAIGRAKSGTELGKGTPCQACAEDALQRERGWGRQQAVCLPRGTLLSVEEKLHLAVLFIQLSGRFRTQFGSV